MVEQHNSHHRQSDSDDDCSVYDQVIGMGTMVSVDFCSQIDHHRVRLLIKPHLHGTTCCQTGLTTGCIVYTNVQPVVKPVVKRV